MPDINSPGHEVLPEKNGRWAAAQDGRAENRLVFRVLRLLGLPTSGWAAAVANLGSLWIARRRCCIFYSEKKTRSEFFGSFTTKHEIRSDLCDLLLVLAFPEKEQGWFASSDSRHIVHFSFTTSLLFQKLFQKTYLTWAKQRKSKAPEKSRQSP